MTSNAPTEDAARTSSELPTATARSAMAGLCAAIVLAALLGPAMKWSPWPTILTAAFSDICHVTAGSVYAMESGVERPLTTAEVISTEKLSHVPGKNISVVRVKFPPGGFSPKHYHGGSVTVYVLSGTIRSQLEGGPAATFGPGETFFEPLGSIHLFAENISQTEPAEVLAVFVHDEGAALTTYF